MPNGESRFSRNGDRRSATPSPSVSRSSVMRFALTVTGAGAFITRFMTQPRGRACLRAGRARWSRRPARRHSAGRISSADDRARGRSCAPPRRAPAAARRLPASRAPARCRPSGSTSAAAAAGSARVRCPRISRCRGSRHETDEHEEAGRGGSERCEALEHRPAKLAARRSRVGTRGHRGSADRKFIASLCRRAPERGPVRLRTSRPSPAMASPAARWDRSPGAVSRACGHASGSATRSRGTTAPSSRTRACPSARRRSAPAVRTR